MSHHNLPRCQPSELYCLPYAIHYGPAGHLSTNGHWVVDAHARWDPKAMWPLKGQLDQHNGGTMSGTKGEIDYAIRRALNKFDEWNDVTGYVPKFCGYYYEIQAVIVDAVHCGFQRALDDEKPLPSEVE